MSESKMIWAALLHYLPLPKMKKCTQSTRRQILKITSLRSTVFPLVLSLINTFWISSRHFLTTANPGVCSAWLPIITSNSWIIFANFDLKIDLFMFYPPFFWTRATSALLALSGNANRSDAEQTIIFIQ